jgi:zinc protease
MRRPALPAAALVAAAALLASCAPSRARLPPAEDLRYGGYFVQRPSGLRIAALHLGDSARASVVVSYAAGSADDPPGKEGVAQLAIDLTRRAVSARGGFTIAERLFAAGAVTAVELRADDVEIRTLARPARLEEILAIEADRLRTPLEGITEPQFLEARESMALALELSSGDPGDDGAVLGDAWRRAWAGTRFDRPLPTPASVRAIEYRDVQAWCATAFSPSRTVMVVTSNTPAAPLVARAVERLEGGVVTASTSAGAVLPFQLGAVYPDPPAASAEVQTTRRVPGAAPKLFLAWAVPGDAGGLANLAAAAARLRARIEERSSKKDLRDRVETIEVGTSRSMSAALLHATVELSAPEDLVPVRDALVAAARVKEKEGASWGDFFAVEWVREEFLRRGVLRAEVAGVVDGARHLRTSAKPDPLAARRAEGKALTFETASEYYRRHVVPERAVAIAVLPESGAAAGPGTAKVTENVRWTLQADLLSGAAPGAAEVERLVEGPRLAGATRHRLTNGLEVAILRRPGMPIAHAHLVVRSRPSDRPAASVARGIALGASHKAWTLGGDLSCPTTAPRSYGESFVFEEQVPAAHLPRALERLACWTRRSLDGTYFSMARGLVSRFFGRLEASPFVQSLAVLTSATYGEAHRRPPAAAAVEALEVKDARRYLAEELRPERSLLVLAGDVHPTPELLAEVERLFGKWKPATAASPASSRPAPAARRVVLVDAPGTTTAQVHLAVRLPPRAEADDAAERVLATALELRLMRGLGPRARGQASVEGLLEEPALEAQLLVERDAAAAAAKDALDAVGALASRPLDAVEANLVRWATARDEAFRFDTVYGAVDAAQLLFVRGQPLDAWDALPASLASVDASRIQAAARASAVGREVLVVTGDAASIGPALDRAGVPHELFRAPERNEQKKR